MSDRDASPYDEATRARIVDEASKVEGVERDAFVRDRARVLHSAALRRLAARTQVVGVGESDFPRTRLTHSLECAQIGRELAVSLGADPDLVDAACLAHDLGHPPFGHNGEAALAAFAADVGGFEGNAQSLRVLSRLEAKVAHPDGKSAGLNLTRATLDAATKYPWPRRSDTPKFGVYDDDRPVFEWLREGAPTGERCVEAQIMDWADDVAYSVHDLEDGVQAGHVPVARLSDDGERAELVALTQRSYLAAEAEELFAALDRLAAQEFWLAAFDGSLHSMVALKRMTSELIARLCGAATRATREVVGDRPIRRYDGQLVIPREIRAECAVLKAVADRYVMSREVTMRAQQVQREQLIELADALAATAPMSLEPWLRDSYTAAADDAAKLRVVVDQVASLTDTSAVAWHARHCRGD
ncbi:MAG: deoxyguanosinetriphosphate triphosphohydrolase [Frankiaceae bacterium]|nr:deoxyguanosinetriphosphate triphosphohydrolase [Frankiaceae bacterium]MBV9873074.1 deoxyguanosinetriphosphate triphosphohydrolase [Frankiaceae bacterium]